MIETKLLQHLGGALSVPVFMESPEEPPGSFVLIEKTGGGEEDHIRRATVAIQSYALSMQEAAQLNEDVKDAMREILARGDISRARLNADYNFTDTAKKHYRYQAVYDLVFFD